MERQVALLIFVVLCISVVTAGSHNTFVLTKSLPPGEHDFGPIDGATVMSEEYYKTWNYTRSVYFQPSEPAARLLVQFVYIDLPDRVGRQTHCRHSLSICEAGVGAKSLQCDIGIISDFCGDLRELFVSNPFVRRLHYVATSHPGRALNIKWKVGRMLTGYRGFKLIVTSFLPESTDCGHDRRYLQCKDGRCVSKDLHCDRIPHCPDGTDEMLNCSSSGVLIPVGHGCPIWQSPCISKPWKERWFGLAIPMVIVMVLLLIAIFVKIRKQLRNPPPAIASARLRHMRTRRRNMRHYVASSIATSRACTLAPALGRQQVVSDPPIMNRSLTEPATVMLLPPPYSPPECIPYEPPHHGEAPPDYSEVYNESDQQKLTPDVTC